MQFCIEKCCFTDTSGLCKKAGVCYSGAVMEQA